MDDTLTHYGGYPGLAGLTILFLVLAYCATHLIGDWRRERRSRRNLSRVTVTEIGNHRRRLN